MKHLLLPLLAALALPPLTIKDYGNGNDRIKLLNGLTESDLTINQAGDNVKIKYEGDLMAIVQDTLIADLNFM